MATIVKVILCGESDVGKSAIMWRYLQGATPRHHQQTIGVEFGSRSLPSFGRDINLMIWDTGGEAVYRTLARSYMRNVAVAVLVFDVTNRRSFEAILQSWMPEMDERGAPLAIVLVGNKVDNGSSTRVVTRAEGEALAETLGRCAECRRVLAWQALVPTPTAPPAAAACTACARQNNTVVYVETSAATGRGVDTVFQRCADFVGRWLQEGHEPGPGVVVPGTHKKRHEEMHNEEDSKPSCCTMA